MNDNETPDMEHRTFHIKSLKYIVLSIVFSSLMNSCGSSKNVSAVKTDNKNNNVKFESSRHLVSEFDGKISGSLKKLLKDAEKYLGAPYKFGGNTSEGFDCSGFAAKVFIENNFQLPRRSSDQALAGKPIDIEIVKPGDLLFFATSGGSRVSHVGIVHTIEKDGEVKFIHASTSKGVIISSLNEKYWNKAYLHAQRVL